MDDQDMKNKKDLLDALDDPGSLSQEVLMQFWMIRKNWKMLAC